MAGQEEDPILKAIDQLQRWAIEGQLKFIYFLVGLTFAILGLSLQTTHQVTWVTKISWTILLLSGLAGIFRLQWEPLARDLEGRKLSAGQSKSELENTKRQAQIEGRPIVHESTLEPLSVDELIRQQAEGEKKVNESLVNVEIEQLWRYRIQIWTFVFGIMGLAVDKIFFN